MFYARPNNLRNLFYFGLDVIEEALERGILDHNGWDIILVGKDIPHLAIANGYVPAKFENLPWAEYAALVGSVDVGLSLMCSAHPSYPPLDLAASGAVAVTNSWEGKTDLTGYSKNILCGDLNPEDMLSTLAEGLRLATDLCARQKNYRSSTILSNWREAFGEVIAQIVRSN